MEAPFTLSTLSLEGKPNARTLLLKGFINDTPYFFTNYDSQKGEEISHNNNVSLTFYWHKLGRQVRVQGVAFTRPLKIYPKSILKDVNETHKLLVLPQGSLCQ